MKTYYKIADSFLEIDGEEKYLHKELELFSVSENEVDNDNKLSIICVEDKITKTENEKIVETASDVIYETEDAYIICYKEVSSVYGLSISKSGETARIYYTQEAYYGDVYLMYAIKEAFFYFLQSKGKVVVHSASIIYDNKAWLFSALSGTGKTTHVNMWREAGYQFEDLNGDTVVCYIDGDGIPIAASIPWCGTSGIYCNLSVPLGGVVFIKRNDINHIEQISQKEGIINLTARCFSPFWNKQLLAKTLKVTKDLGKKISLLELNCRPDTEAAKVVKEYIDIM